MTRTFATQAARPRPTTAHTSAHHLAPPSHHHDATKGTNVTDIDPAVPRLHPRLLSVTLAIAITVTVVIGTVSFISSFTVLADLAREFGWPAGKEWHFPVIVDGTIAATMLVVLALSQHTDKETVRRRAFVRSLQYFAVAVSVGGNAFHAYQTQDETWRSWIAAAIASIAPIFLLAMTETVKFLTLAPRSIRPATQPEPVQPETHHQAEAAPAPDWDQAAAAELEPVGAETIDLVDTTDATTETPSSAALFAHPTDPDSDPDPELLREFLKIATLDHVVRTTAELRLDYPDATWEAIGEQVGGVRHSTAMRRWDKFIGAAREAGYVRANALT